MAAHYQTSSSEMGALIVIIVAFTLVHDVEATCTSSYSYMTSDTGSSRGMMLSNHLTRKRHRGTVDRRVPHDLSQTWRQLSVVQLRLGPRALSRQRRRQRGLLQRFRLRCRLQLLRAVFISLAGKYVVNYQH